MFSEMLQEMSSKYALLQMLHSAEFEPRMFFSANNIMHPTRQKDSELQHELLRSGDDER